ncbi:hypothetical protein [Adhaeribacter rhizoryzae]|uniref:Uncharacterized protein n=1 Tax=Adhaeribacter rhizoryzae TaxID=2607907 RepID=A0A5M6DBC7_9BACT|nr:hypothetical protein [Adhaeribacter rhizoryzae]KAA5544847.1 hypothetical protein F0145_14290 [Adhaeribacter rhizoryzae]
MSKLGARVSTFTGKYQRKNCLGLTLFGALNIAPENSALASTQLCNILAAAPLKVKTGNAVRSAAQ